jgi:hypothetical protein
MSTVLPQDTGFLRLGSSPPNKQGRSSELTVLSMTRSYPGTWMESAHGLGDVNSTHSLHLMSTAARLSLDTAICDAIFYSESGGQTYCSRRDR